MGARLAVLMRPDDHYSLALYRDAVVPRLATHGITVCPFDAEEGIPPTCDAVWDPALGTRRVPDVLLTSTVPVVVTVLGLRSLAVPVTHLSASAEEAAFEATLKEEILAGWQRLRPRLAAVITISAACAADVIAHLAISPEIVHAIHLAVDRRVFTPTHPLTQVPREHILTVALGGLARKNIHRMLAAYERVSEDLRIPFVIKLQNAVLDGVAIGGVRVLPGHCTAEELADCYRRARFLLFPSVYEGFGLPILEAMSSGCPVITSNTHACAEVAGGTALLVDPFSTTSIARAMERLLRDDAEALALARRGLERAGDFDWDRSAAAHADVFLRAVNAVPSAS